MALRVAGLAVLAASPYTPRQMLNEVTPSSVLQRAADMTSQEFNCTIAIGYKSQKESLAAVSGFIDAEHSRKTQVTDRFVWGSVTKCLTGSSILRLVNEGKIALNDPVAMHVDPFLKKCMANARDKSQIKNFTTLESLLGPNASKFTVDGLGKMQTCVPDFDTANARTGNLTDSFRAIVESNPHKEWGPLDILSLPWVNTGDAAIKEGYSSTNYLLLGMVLANYDEGVQTWEDFRQSDYIPIELRNSLPSLAFGSEGAPKDYTAVVGYDRTTYNGHNPNESQPVSAFAGVFAGWTASDYVADVTDTAALVWAIYGTEQMIPRKYIEHMIPDSPFYGFGTFNLTGRTGVSPPEGTAYGHLGATYGYQSIVAYFPYYNFSLAIASNIEKDDQAQPAAALCRAFNGIRALLEGRAPPKWCNVTHGSYYHSGCNCSA